MGRKEKTSNLGEGNLSESRESRTVVLHQQIVQRASSETGDSSSKSPIPGV